MKNNNRHYESDWSNDASGEDDLMGGAVAAACLCGAIMLNIGAFVWMLLL